MTRLEAEKLVIQDVKANILDVEDAHRARLLTTEDYVLIREYAATLSRIEQDAKELA